MTRRYQLAHDGQQVLTEDYNGLGAAASHGEDHTYAELFRMTPGDGTNVARGILPTGTAALVAPNGGTGSVVVSPFRALIGSRSDPATDAQLAWLDVRAAYSVAEGSTSLTTAVALAANASGNPRWDAIYARVDVDKAGTSVDRKVKAPGTGVVESMSVAAYRETVVTIAAVTGTASGSPAFPALPADDPSLARYYILLGYVRVPSGFTSGSTVANTDIVPQAPVLRLSSTTGGLSLSTATSNAVISSTVQSGWGTTGGRHGTYLPTSLTGGTTLLACVDLRTGSESHTNGQVVDSRDWRGRMFRSWISVGQANTARLAFDPAGGGGVARVPQTLERGYGVSQNLVAHYFGQSVKDWDADGLYAATQ